VVALFAASLAVTVIVEPPGAKPLSVACQLVEVGNEIGPTVVEPPAEMVN
jgi:hypothetical protein